MAKWGSWRLSSWDVGLMVSTAMFGRVPSWDGGMGFLFPRPGRGQDGKTQAGQENGKVAKIMLTNYFFSEISIRFSSFSDILSGCELSDWQYSLSDGRLRSLGVVLFEVGLPSCLGSFHINSVLAFQSAPLVGDVRVWLEDISGVAVHLYHLCTLKLDIFKIWFDYIWSILLQHADDRWPEFFVWIFMAGHW